jgi:hypothetical protein
MGEYQESLNTYRDMHNVIQTAHYEGKLEGKIERIQKALKRGKLTLEEIVEDFEVSIDFVLDIQKKTSFLNRVIKIPKKKWFVLQ